MKKIILILFILPILLFSQTPTGNIVTWHDSIYIDNSGTFEELRSYLGNSYGYDISNESTVIANDALDDHSGIQALIDRSDVNYIRIGNSRTDTFLVSQPIIIDKPFKIDIYGGLMPFNNDSTTLAEDALEDSSWFIATDASKFAVGEWVGVMDTTTQYGYATWWGWTGEILSISGDTITLDNACWDTISVDSGSIVANVSNLIIIDSTNNVTIDGHGSGWLHGDRANKIQIHPVRDSGPAEQQRAGCGITIWKSDYVTIRNMDVDSCLLHNVIATGETNGDCKHIRVEDVNLSYGHDKNLIYRLVEHGWITRVYSEYPTWEDAIMCYNDCEYIYVNDVEVIGAPRYGFGWNGGASNILSASGIIARDNLWGIAVRAKNAQFNNIYTEDPIQISNVYGGHDIAFNNLKFKNVTADYLIYSVGNVNTVQFSNVSADSCTGAFLKTLKTFGGSPAEPLEGAKFVGGGIYNHDGGYFDLEKGTDVTFTAFDPSPTSGFDPTGGDSIQYLFRADSGQTRTDDSVTVWIDRIVPDTLVQDTVTRKPLGWADSNFVRFDGINDFLYDSTATIMDLPTWDFTISGMAMFDTNATSWIFSKYVDATDRIGLYVAGDDLFLLAYSGTDTIYAYTNGNYLDEGSPFMFSCAFDVSGSAQFYINGGAVTTVTANMDNVGYSPSTPFNVGSSRHAPSGNTYLNGDIYWLQMDNELVTSQWAFDFYWYLRSWNETF